MKSKVAIPVLSLLICAIAAIPAQAAKKETKSCTVKTSSGKIKTTTVGTDVDPRQRDVMTCVTAAKVVKYANTTRIQKDFISKSTGYNCKVSVSSKNPNLTSYRCTFRGADTATQSVLTFKIQFLLMKM